MNRERTHRTVPQRQHAAMVPEEPDGSMAVVNDQGREAKQLGPFPSAEEMVLYKERAQRIAWALRLLAVMLALVTVDAINRDVRLRNYASDVQLVAHDFATQYAPSLAEWRAKLTPSPEYIAPAAGTALGSGAFDVRFDESTGPRKGSVSLDAVPLMGAYMRQKGFLQSGKRQALGYDTEYPVFLLGAITIPLGLLTVVFFNAVSLRTLREHLRGSEAKAADMEFVLNSIAFSRIARYGSDVWNDHATCLASWLFALTAGTIVVALGLQSWPVVHGVLHIGQARLPEIIVDWHWAVMDRYWLRATVTWLIVCAWYCFQIRRVLVAKDDWERIRLYMWDRSAPKPR